MDDIKRLASLCIWLSLCTACGHPPNTAGAATTGTAKDNAGKTQAALPTPALPTPAYSPQPDPNLRAGLCSQTDDDPLFTDAKYGYSIRYPATWKREPTASAPGPAATLFLSTPRRNQFVVSVYPLPGRVERYSSAKFDQIGHDHVDRVLAAYRGLLKISKVLREQAEDHSNDQAMIFWQGTSALDEKMKDWAIVSTHAIRYGSDFMVNLVFFGSDSNDVVKDGSDMDAVMNSLSFPGR